MDKGEIEFYYLTLKYVTECYVPVTSKSDISFIYKFIIDILTEIAF